MIEKLRIFQKSIKQFQKEQTAKTADQLLLDLRIMQPEIDELRKLCYEIIDREGETEHFKSYGKVEIRNLKTGMVKKILDEAGLMSPDLFAVSSFLMIRKKKEVSR